jgi:hypothetical protein
MLIPLIDGFLRVVIYAISDGAIGTANSNCLARLVGLLMILL